MSKLTRIQKAVYKWKQRNFGVSSEVDQFIGVVEEVGELAHSLLKTRQGIRGDAHEAEARDAVGDIMIFLMNYCSMNRWNLEEILDETWNEVKQRDWLTFPKDGRSE